MRRSSLLVCLLFVLGVPSLAQIIHVPADQPTIQAGIDITTPGDTVMVAEGTYYENINFKGKALTVASLFLLDADTAHISRTIINGSRATDPTRASVVTLCSGEDSTSVLCGFTITGGTGTYLPDVHTEKGMRNWRNICGGGILMHLSGGKIVNNIIENNLVQTDTIRGAYGAGIMANVNEGRTAIIRNNIIKGNHIKKRQGWGAGVLLLGGRILLEHNAIVENSIETEYLAVGAGVFFQNDSTEGGIGLVAIRNNLLVGNNAISKSDQGLGGGIGLCYGHEENVMEISYNIICENHTNGIGGGIYDYSGRGRVSGNLIFDNIAEMYGGAYAGEQEPRLVLESNHIWSGNVWLASNPGICRLHVSRIGSEGITRILAKANSSFTDTFTLDPGSGSLLIGKEEGMLSFRPYSVPLGSFAPPMVIIDFRQTETASSRSRDLKLDLSYRENFLKFKFSALELAETDIYQYSTTGYNFRYYLEGWDQDTAMTGMDLTAAYQNLKPGRYRFLVTRSEGEDRLNPVSMSLNIRIHPPWYRSGLAFGLYLLFLVILITGISQLRTARLKREKLALEKEVEIRTAEINEKNNKILEMEQLKTRFFTDVSHEIRTPLSLIAGPIEELVSMDHRDSRITRLLSLIRRNSQRMRQLVDQVLDISRPDTGHMKLVLEESDVAGHIRSLASEYRSLAETKEIRFIVDIAGESRHIIYDREKLEKICTNLLSNAFKYTSRGGTVSCRLKISGDLGDRKNPQIRILVADTGQGIPASLHGKIFERFYRGEDDLSRLSEGTGVGLALTRELVRIMHGKIVIKSKEGAGTVLMVTLPAGYGHLKKEEYILKESGNKNELGYTPDKESRQPVQTGGPETENLSILVVEDNRDLQDFLMENLALEYRVSGAYDGDQGLSMAISEMPDLVITDVMMPGGMDGMELCNKLKNDERTSHIPVVILTAKSTGRDKITGLEQGADDYIIKPFSMDELFVRIRNLLKQRERLRKKYSSMIGVDWEDITVTTLDERFLKRMLEIISENLTDFNFGVKVLQEKMFMSREHIFRKLKALTGVSPSSLIRLMRLKAAASLLERGEESITSISMQVGFSNPSYFSQCFKAYYNRSPSEYKLRKPANYTP